MAFMAGDRRCRAHNRPQPTEKQQGDSLRRHELAANFLFLAPILFGIAFALAACWPVNYIILVAIYACGLIDLGYAKMPLLRHGVLNTFGPSHIPRKRREAYFRGYRRITVGIAFNLLVVVAYSVLAPPL